MSYKKDSSNEETTQFILRRQNTMQFTAGMNGRRTAPKPWRRLGCYGVISRDTTAFKPLSASFCLFLLSVFSLNAAYDRGAVLPFTLKDSKAYFLLGKERHGIQPWDDFGGGLNKNESPEEGAYREGSEESKLIFGKLEQNRKDFTPLKNNEILVLLQNSKKFIQNHQWNVLKTGTYRIVIKIKYIDPKIFNNAKTANQPELNEKSEYKWFRVKDLIDLLPPKNIDKKTIDNITYSENNKTYLISKYFARDLFELRNRGLADQIFKLENEAENIQAAKELTRSFEKLTEKLYVLDTMLLSLS